MGARTWAIGQGTSDEDAGKRDWPALLAELWKARGDAARQQELIRNEGAVLLASRWAGSFYKPFTAPGYTLYYSQYKDVLPGGPTGAHPQHGAARRVELPDARGSSHGPALPAHGIQQRKLQLDGAHGRRILVARTWRPGEAAVFRFVPGQPGARVICGGPGGVEFERCTGGTRSRRRWCCTNRRATPR